MTNAVSRAAALLWIAALPPITGLSGPAYANAAALRGGYQEICVVCAASLALGGEEWEGVLFVVGSETSDALSTALSSIDR